MNYSEQIQSLLDLNALDFYGSWQIGVCFFAFIALMAIWWHIGKKQGDFGQVWLALSVLCWSISGMGEVLYSSNILGNGQLLLEMDNQETFENYVSNIHTQHNDKSYLLDGWRSILSLFNSLFILMALPWFKYIPKRIESIIKSKYWLFIVGLPFLFSLLPTISKMVSGANFGLISELDVYYAVLTLGFLGWVLWESFEKRRLTVLAWLSVLCILITFVAQVFKFGGSSNSQLLFSAIFKASLIMIFFALALSWVKELTEIVKPDPNKLLLNFEKRKNEKGKIQSFLNLKGFPGKDNLSIQLTPALFDLLLNFAKHRKDLEDDWLEIKPKNEARTGKEYQIHDHNQIKRLLTALLDGIYGKGAWTKNQHEQTLRNALFEMSDKRDRKIRLLIPPENLTF